MIGVALLLIMTPIAIKVICRKKTTNNEESLDEQPTDCDDGTDKSKYKRFENQPVTNDKSINL